MDLPPLRREIETLEEQGIDPSAMFYTELDTMDEVRRRLTETLDEHSDAFWRPSPSEVPLKSPPKYIPSRSQQ